MAPESSSAATLRGPLVLGLLAGLLGVSVVLAETSSGTVMRLAVLALAAAKVVLVVSEYVEVRGSARWLVGVWIAWGVLVFGGLAVLSW